MKAILFCALVVASLGAYAATLSKEVIEGTKKICIYSDGSTVTVSAAGYCPRSN